MTDETFMGWENELEAGGHSAFPRGIKATCQQVARRVRELGHGRVYHKGAHHGFQPKHAVNNSATPEPSPAE